MKKYVLITGAYGGMGRKTVETLKKQGFFVFAMDKKVEEAEENVLPLEADVTNAESVRAAFEKVREITGELYAIVHFAGIYLLDSLVEIENERFERAFEVNLFGAFNVNKAFLPLLKKGSRIIITTSELAPLGPLPFTGIYAVTKGALDKYAYSLRMELQLLGISVSVLRAGAVATDMLGVSTDALDKFCRKTKLYSCNAERFKKIVESVEARCVPPEKIAAKTQKILGAKKPKFAYSINRNPLLLLLNVLPKRTQLLVIKQILK
ncbi:MAG: SDR family NAD(P)-dependent oxidoreductase [Clostridia bacterium]|nr:SDR family NAD(P)-dependent oxidoreductase [Clostridia bacterium]